MVVDNSYFDTNLYNFNNLSGCAAGNPYQCYCLARPAAIPDCQNGVCTAAELATSDAYDVSCAVVASNPAAHISLSCADNNVLDADACSAGSRHRIVIAWPAANWQNINRVLNPICNTDPAAEPQDCVTLDVTL